MENGKKLVRIRKAEDFYEKTVMGLCSGSSENCKRAVEILRGAELLEEAAEYADEVIIASNIEYCNNAEVGFEPVFGSFEITREIRYLVSDGPDSWWVRGECYQCVEPPCVIIGYHGGGSRSRRVYYVIL